MSTDKKENTELPENVATTEDEETVFTFTAILAFINVAAELFCIMFLGTGHCLMDFTVKDRSNVNELHGYIFRIFAAKQGVCISNATLWIFVAGLVAMIISFNFSRKNEHKLKHLFLMLSTGLNLIAGIYYLLAICFGPTVNTPEPLAVLSFTVFYLPSVLQALFGDFSSIKVKMSPIWISGFPAHWQAFLYLQPAFVSHILS